MLFLFRNEPKPVVQQPVVKEEEKEESGMYLTAGLTVLVGGVDR